MSLRPLLLLLLPRAALASGRPTTDVAGAPRAGAWPDSEHLMLQQTARRSAPADAVPWAAMVATSSEMGVAARRGGGAGHLQRTLVALQRYATAVVNGSERLSSTQLEVLQGIREEIGIMMNATSVGHHEDQGEVDRANELLLECGNRTMHLGGKAESSSSKEEAHSACRTAEGALKAEKAATCKAYMAAAMEQEEPPACFGIYDHTPPAEAVPATHACLRQVTAWASALNRSLAEKQRACEAATEEHADQVAECSRLQTAYETAFCGYHEGLTGFCSSYETCRSSRTASQEKVQAEVRVAEAGRKSQVVAGELIKCFLGVFEASAEEQPGRLLNCSDLEPDTSALNISYHTPPLVLDCDVRPPATYPCGAPWLARQYESQPWFPEAKMATCTACAHAAAAPTDAPTSAPEPAGTWDLAANVNPCDGHDFGYGGPWSRGVGVGSAGAALTKDFLDVGTWSRPAGYIAIARHVKGQCQMAKTWRLTDSARSLQEYFSTYPGRMHVTGDGSRQDSHIHADMPSRDHLDSDPIFGADGGLVFNWYYSNNGARIAVTGSYKVPYALPGAGENNDDLHGLGNEFGAGTSSGAGSGAWRHDVGQRQGDCHGGSCKVVGTDRGSHLRSQSCWGGVAYAIYVSTEAERFECTDVTLSPQVEVAAQ